MPLLRRFRQIDAFNNGLDKLVIQVDPATDFNAEAIIPVDVTGTPIGTAANPMVTTGAGVGGGAAATATAAPPTFVEGQSVPLSVDLSGNLRTAGGGGGTSSTVDVTDRAARLLGHTTVDNFPATQPVSGTVNVGNFPATQPISAASLPLPTGAATESSLGTDGAAPPTIPGSGVRGWLRAIYDKLAGTLNTDVSDRSARLLGHTTVDNFPATQPVSGTVTANAGTGVFDVTPTTPAANDYLPVRLTDGAAFYVAGGGGGSGGAVTVADGADVAQGTTTDAAWTSGAGTVVGLLKAVVGAILGTLTVNVTDRAARLLGHVTVDNASLAVTGTFWQATQPVSGSVTNQQSNVTADYDSGAGTQNLTMFGMALPASGGAVSGGTSTNPIRTDPTGTTTQPVSAASLPLPTNAAQEHTGAASYHSVRLTDGAAFYTASGGAGGNLATGAKGTTAAGNPTSTNVDANTQALDVNLKGTNSVSVSNLPATQPVSGTVTANQGGAPWSNNISQIGGAALALGQAAGASSIPVVQASDRSTLSQTLNTALDTTQAVTLTLNNNGTVGVQITGTWTGTISFEATVDGTNWLSISGMNLNTQSSAQNTTGGGLFAVNVSGMVIFRTRCSVVGTGSATVSIVASTGGGLSSLIAALPASTNRIGKVRLVDSADADLTAAKGTQSSRFMGVQDVKDSGRQSVTLNWEEMAGTAAVESALTNFTSGQRNVAALTAASSYTVSAGKTLRIQAINIYLKNTGTAALLARFRIRQAASSIANSSPIIWGAVLAQESPTWASGEGEANPYTIPDGLEVGAGQEVTFTWFTNVNSCTVGMSIIGYEY